jgi:hypothetical protein
MQVILYFYSSEVEVSAGLKLGRRKICIEDFGGETAWSADITKTLEMER